MSDEEGAGDYRAPLGVTCDDDEPNGFVRLIAVIPNLEVKKQMTMKGMKTVPANGNIDSKFNEQSICIKLELANKSTVEKFRVLYRKLPDKIVPEESYYKLKAKQVIIFLKKSENRSWARELASTGLETLEPEET